MAYGYYGQIKDILTSFLGEPRRDVDEGWMQFCCPCCALEKGVSSDGKYNLEVSIDNGAFHCWACGDTSGTKGKLSKLIRTYGGYELLNRYKDILKDLRESSLYTLNFANNNDLALLEDMKEEITLPQGFRKLYKTDIMAEAAYLYLYNRGITDEIIERHGIGYVGWVDDFRYRTRIVIPSYDMFGELNYWVARDYSGKSKYKYSNPLLPKTMFVFNEGLINWYEDITLVEGPFDHIVVPNSIPLLGKTLGVNDAVFRILREKARANINVMVDGDARESAVRICKLLVNNGFKGRVRLVENGDAKDPSDIFKAYGPRGIIQCLRDASPIDEFLINFA